MPTLYKIEKERKFVLTTGSGFVTKEEVLALQDKMSINPEFDSSLFRWRIVGNPGPPTSGWRSSKRSRGGTNFQFTHAGRSS